MSMHSGLAARNDDRGCRCRFGRRRGRDRVTRRFPETGAPAGFSAPALRSANYPSRIREASASPSAVARNTAIWPRVTGVLGQKFPPPQPAVIPAA